MSTRKNRASRQLERFRAKVKRPSVAVTPGKGKREAREATAVNIRAALAQRKKSGKASAKFDGLDVAALQEKLAEARHELFKLRFTHATAQLENVAAIPATKRLIARLLTLIKQKEVGA